MTTLLPATLPTTEVTISEQRVLDACSAAKASGRDFVQKACLAGSLLMEFRVSICLCDGRTGGTNDAIRHNQHTSSDKKFILWIESHDISRSTAYFWMAAAERASRYALNLKTGDDFTTTIDVEGVPVPLSHALTTPDDELSSDALKFKQAWFDFMADKTLTEAARAVLDGESPASRITRAASGKSTGGKGDIDRKQFVHFAAQALADCLHHIGDSRDKKGGHWRSLNAADKQQALNNLHLFLCGLPTEALEFIRDDAKAQCLHRKAGQRSEPLALKSVVLQTKGAKAAAADKSNSR